MEKLLELIKEAGQLALKEQETMSVSVKEDTSIVTNGDLAVSSFLEKGLKELYPEWDIFSEENCKVLPSSNKVIVIDPIDGTESYSRKQDTWSILVGFLEDGQPVRSVVYQPSKNKIYYAEKNKGAYCEEDGKKYKMDSNSRKEELKGLMTFKPVADEIQLAQDLKIFEIEFMYSAGLKIMEVSKANADYYSNFRGKCSIWDLVAPLMIIRESGGEMYFKTDMKFDFNKILMDEDFVVCNKRVHLPSEWKKMS